MHHLLKQTKIKLGIVNDLGKFFLKHKLWWIIPIVFILLFLMLFLYIAGHTGIAAFIYPIF